MKTALIAGYTGLVGRELLQLLLASDRYKRVVGIGRRKLGLEHHKLEEIIVDFDNLRLSEPIDDVFCCLGSTMKKAGSREKFRVIDFNYPLNLAIAAMDQGATTFVLVSANGADKSSAFFYNRVKGDIEEAIARLAYEKFEIVRPSLLLGDRQESRRAEDLGKLMMKLTGFLFIGPLKNAKAIQGATVARAMHALANDGSTGRRVHKSGVLQRFK